MKHVKKFDIFLDEQILISKPYQGLSQWIVRYYIIPGSGSLRKLQMEAYDRNDCIKRFEAEKGISRDNIISVRKYNDETIKST